MVGTAGEDEVGKVGLSSLHPVNEVVDVTPLVGRPQPGQRQLRSLATTARRIPTGMVRVARPTSKGWDSPLVMMRLASQASRRAASGVMTTPVWPYGPPGFPLQGLQVDEH